MTETETISAGPPLKYALKGVKEIPSRQRRSSKSIAHPIQDKYGTELSVETGNILERLYSAVDGLQLVEAIQQTSLDEADEYDYLLEYFDNTESEGNDLSDVMNVLDQKIHHGLATRENDPSDATNKGNRQSIYVPKLINMADGGTVYMAKSLTTVSKLRMAWDLNKSNQVVVVDDYDKWERLLGWEKLKKFPHGKNKIREEYGDRLSDDLLQALTGSSSSTTSSDSSSSSSSSGRRTRTEPTDEVLNVATSNRNRDRFKRQAKNIKEQFEDDGFIGMEYSPVKMLILFPTTTDKNMSDHWWVPGTRWNDGSGKAAVANCNKGTFEYLNDCDNVWHIEDYLDQASEYEFVTNDGPVTIGDIDESNLVIHMVPDDTKRRFLKQDVVTNLPEILQPYVDRNRYNSPELPHHEDMLYAPVTKEQMFWLRPALRENYTDDSPFVCYGESSPRDINKTYSLSSDYKLYARARLNKWDFDWTEMEVLDAASFSISLDDGGYELVETLGKLHDNDMNPFSQTPEARWDK